MIAGKVAGSKPCLGYGAKVGLAFIGREALRPDTYADTVHRVAVDIATYDQQSCLAPQTVFVETDGALTPREVAQLLGGELENQQRKYPRSVLSDAENVAIQRARTDAEMRALMGGKAAVFASGHSTAWSVLYRELDGSGADEDVASLMSPLNRTVNVVAVPDLLDAARRLTSCRGWLQSCGVAVDSTRLFGLADILAAVGVNRICPLGGCRTRQRRVQRFVRYGYGIGLCCCGQQGLVAGRKARAMTEQSDMARRPMVNLDGRTAIITGSGKGIGAAVAKCLASHGAAVVINYVHDAASAQRTVEDIHSLGGLAIAVQADVCDESQSSKLVGTAVDSFGGVDILVNNAFGRFSFDPRRRSTFAGGDWDEFSAQIEGCLHGAYLMCSHVVPLMRAQTSGRIINISSNLVDSPIVPYHSYITAKGGLVGMTRSLAQELGGFGITVNAIAAGLTAGTASSAASTEEVRERIIAMTPLGRLARPDDIAGGVALLASDMAGFITGQCLHVDGGLTMR
ncbi:3-oxoacyl-[acyl-carrier-protein] reductase FabG [Bifidobacterium breve]|nr:3-oxoacyl-[acyl-carrier-protein] reductase FabG [Bifidobacterium breve]